jgi:hypothetical protein
MAYRDALGMPVESVEDYDKGIGCMYTLEDLRAVLKMFPKRELSLITWIRQFLTAKKPIFSWDDPIPAIYNAFVRPFRYLKRRIRKLDL